MASLSLSPNLANLPSLLHPQSPKLPPSPSLCVLSKSAKSHFYPLKFRHPSSTPSYSSAPKSFIFAKVTKGTVPPEFTLKDQEGKNVSLSKFKGKPVVVYFYPADETPGCTKQMLAMEEYRHKMYQAHLAIEIYCYRKHIPMNRVYQGLKACAFRDSYEKFKKAGAEVVGISNNNTTSHKNFAKKYRLPFTLLSDEGNRVRKEWGVPGDFFGALPGRQTYVLDKNGVVQLIYNNQFQPEKHVDETLKLLPSL